MEIKMVKTTYYFDFEERIPERKLEKIILITRSGFSYDGKLSKNYENEEKKNSFSLLNILIFSSLFIYIPVIVRINVVWNNIDKIFMETTVKIMEIIMEQIEIYRKFSIFVQTYVLPQGQKVGLYGYS